jgi:hypothetical protein
MSEVDGSAYSPEEHYCKASANCHEEQRVEVLCQSIDRYDLSSNRLRWIAQKPGSVAGVLNKVEPFWRCVYVVRL